MPRVVSIAIAFARMACLEHSDPNHVRLDTFVSKCLFELQVSLTAYPKILSYSDFHWSLAIMHVIAVRQVPEPVDKSDGDPAWHSGGVPGFSYFL